MTEFLAPISEQIWDMKYRFKEPDGAPIDQTLQDTWARVADALAAAEDPKKQDFWGFEFYEILKAGQFVPAGRIISGAGTDRDVTLANCYTMGTIPDSMDGIFSMLKEAALTMQQGGGIGYDFSTLRPKGALVKGVGADASGPLSFMDVWDAMCRTVMSAGSRRGAMMATMRCDHPDIFDFIEAKRDPARLRMFNLSVMVTDDFMQAVEADADWELLFDGEVYSTVAAVDLWNAIMQSTYDYAEPGVLFIDRINEEHNIRYLEEVTTTNPCGEKPMGPYASCILGSVNLARLIDKPFARGAEINLKELTHVVTVGVRMLDNVIEVSNYPLPEQKQKAQEDRQIGLGVTGLADALAMVGLRYGSPEAVDWTRWVMNAIATTAYSASVDLAKEKGAFPTFDVDGFFAEGTFASKRIGRNSVSGEMIEKHGIRNSLLTSIAPTGTISLLSGNVSSGIEPIFALEYDRKVLLPDGSHKVETVEDYAVAKWRELKGDEPLPDYFVTAQDLSPEDHIRMQAAAQIWVDSSISKTVNVPKDISFEAFKGVYRTAYDMGCKGCTTYRPNEITGSVLSTTKAEPEAPEQPEPSTDLIERPQTLAGQTYKMKWPLSPHSIYVTINDTIVDGKRKPFEIFINSKNTEHFAWTVALTRMISAVFRRGGDVSFVPEELKAVFDPQGGAWVQGKYLPSILAMIGDIVEQHLKKFEEGEIVVEENGAGELAAPIGLAHPTPCVSCGSFSTKFESGCRQCLDCGHSACG